MSGPRVSTSKVRGLAARMRRTLSREPRWLRLTSLVFLRWLWANMAK
ncbi:hypothetical protein RSOL_372310 [Rhizoctonia solani AG-3 Rhs1AP]|uniref:Uncharacterized protein n=1 Tax=Rhizoctonia solani AG-3 Rhs1AP TaxID=1086054 RepID=X8JC67_9AGAM|nr:hypothetical protein RSOL_372310 [Rhizoctonia solani AG-3 Rhs1AP]